MRTRYVSFAGNTVAIDHCGDEQDELLDYLFGDLGGRETSRPLSRFRLAAPDEAGRIRLEQDGKSLYAGSDRTALARTLTEKTLYTLIKNDRSGLAIHAAAVASDAGGVLIPGQSGAGKSTLALWLASRGFRYLTDELVHIPLNTSRIEAFTRPINLKRNGIDLFAAEVSVSDQDESILRNEHASLVPHRLVNASSGITSPEIHVILFPCLASTEEHRLEPLSKGQAGLRLVECLVNGRNIANHGINQVSRIVRDVPAYVLHYTGFDSLPGLLAGILPQPAAGTTHGRSEAAV